MDHMNSLLTVLPYIQIVLSILLVIGILLQRSDAGLGGAFGASDVGGGVSFERRGFEKMSFNFTIFIAILFAFSAILSLILG